MDLDSSKKMDALLIDIEQGLIYWRQEDGQQKEVLLRFTEEQREPRSC